MTSNYSCISEDDDFFKSLDESLTTQLSSVMLPNFITDLIEAINNLEDNTGDGFLFYEDDEYAIHECFTYPTSETDICDEQQQCLLYEKDNENIAENEILNVSDDMFAEFQDDQEIVDVERIDQMTIDEQENVQFPQEEHSEHIPMVTSVQNVEVVEECPLLTKGPRVQHATNQILIQSPTSEDPPIVENLDNEELSECGDIVLCVPSIISDTSTYCEQYENLVKSPTTLQGAEQSSNVSTGFNRLPSERTKSAERMPSTECIGLSRFFTPIAEAVNSPLRGSLSGATLLQGFSPQTIINSEVLQQQRNRCLSRFFTPIAEAVSSPLRSSLSEATLLQGFSPQTIIRSESLRQRRNRCLSEKRNDIESDLNSTICEEYEATRNPAPGINMTEVGAFDLDEAYTQCFLGCQNENENENSNAERRQIFIDEIEKLVLRLSNDLICGRKLQIPVAYQLTWNNCALNNERLSLKPLANGKTRKIMSNRKIGVVLYVLSYVYKLLISNATCTIREIYYSHPEFTQKQDVIDRAVKEVCLILNACPWEIGILSSSKGLIAGSVKLILNDDSIINVGNIGGGILLPHLTTSIKKVETTAKFVLLVEKHTVYEKLLTENILIRMNPCILITGKGYPDINTRVIVKKIWDDCKCPIYALVDADPYGIEIMLTYRHGSLNMSHCTDDLAIPSIRWIGVYPSEIKSLCLQHLPLTEEDELKIDRMIKRPYISTRVYQELLALKDNSYKTEVEALTSSGINDWIKSYLFNKIKKGIFI